jgi:hypothetical protein
MAVGNNGGLEALVCLYNSLRIALWEVYSVPKPTQLGAVLFLMQPSRADRSDRYAFATCPKTHAEDDANHATPVDPGPEIATEIPSARPMTPHPIIDGEFHLLR